MKRCVSILLSCLLLMCALPLCVGAAVFSPSETDIHVTVDDTMWYVFTRDNLEGNPELEELGLSADAIRTTLIENNTYLDAALFYEDGSMIEMFVRKMAVDTELVNLSNYPDEIARDFARGVAEAQGTTDYDIYKNDYTFTEVDAFDEELGYYVHSYATLVNKEVYSVTFQSLIPFSAQELADMKTIVDSVRFDIDPTLTEPTPDNENGGFSLRPGVIGAIAGGLSALLARWLYKKKKSPFPKTLAANAPVADAPADEPPAEETPAEETPVEESDAH